MQYHFAHTTDTSQTRPEMPLKQPVLAPKPGLELVMYSEKSFAIFGETKPVKEQLMALGGSFNRSLKREDKPTPGYIFSLKRIDSVRKALSI